MARLRTLKPGFFTNDELGELPPLARILFAGLWCLADREGRLYDRPKRIKAEALPFDRCNVDQLLGLLAERGFILRYSVNGEACIQIVNFRKHQTPHIHEQKSTVPAPDKHGASTVQAPDESDHTPPADTLPAPLLLGSGEWEPGSENLSSLPVHKAEVSQAEPSQPMARVRALAVPKPGGIGEPHLALFRAFARHLHCDEPTTKSERDKWGRPIVELVRAGVTPDEIPALVRAFDESTSQDVPCTPQGIANRLSSLRAPRLKAKARNDEPRGFEGLREAFADLNPQNALEGAR